MINQFHIFNLYKFFFKLYDFTFKLLIFDRSELQVVVAVSSTSSMVDWVHNDWAHVRHRKLFQSIHDITHFSLVLVPAFKVDPC